MAESQFDSFPECCQALLRKLEKEGRGGTRNCAKGHSVSLEYARAVETKARAKKNQSAA
jgi:hypothetical protein